MSIKWNDNQINAINSSGNNILVSAAAGSGKTAVLVERVIRMITDTKNPVSIDRILMVTFTKAAAAEMKIRIYKAIKNCIEKDPTNHILHNQLALLGQAQISTIHSFCENILKDNFYKVGLAPDFKIIDSVDSTELMIQAAEEAVEEGYTLYPEHIDTLISLYGGRFDDGRLKNLIIKLFNFLQSQPYPELWLENMVDMYSKQFEETVWGEFLLDTVKTNLKQSIKYYDDAIKLAETGGVDSYIALLCAEQKAVEDLLDKIGGWDETRNLIASIEFKRLPNKTKGCDEFCANGAKDLRDSGKKLVVDLKKQFCDSNENLTNELKNQYEIINCIRILTLRFSEIFAQKKAEVNSLDFNDLLHVTLNKLLSDDEYLLTLQERFDEILVDEFQDTNAINVAIFERLSNGKNLFMVGDVKQSIYGFINARPESFIERYDSYSEEGNENGKKIYLSNNYRSAENILDFSNSIFEKLMTKQSSGIHYSSDQRLVYSNNEVNTNLPVEIHLLETKDFDGIYPENDKLSNEAYFTAKRILSLVEIEKPLIYDDKIKAERPVRYSDIAILSRGIRGGVAVEFTKQLAMMGIPVTCDETGSYLMTVEIMTLISYLKLIDNPYQDIPMLSVMRSPMYGFTENELAEIKAKFPELPFYKAVFASENQKVISFLSSLNKYIEISKTESIEFLIEKILSDTGYYSFVGMLPGGKQRMENLKLLVTRANMFEKYERKSIFEYITYMNSMLENGNEYTTAKTLSDIDNCVSIMTIHKSKGLEFPFVFLVQCGKKINKTGDNENPADYSADMGIGLDYISNMVKYPSMPKNVIKMYNQNKSIAEEIRVLYVALTRPKNFLCIIGSVENAENKLIKLSKTIVDDIFIKKAASFFDWIIACSFNKTNIQVHQISEIISEVPYVKTKPECIGFSVSITEKSVNDNLSYSYQFSEDTTIPLKVSVTELVSDTVIPRLNKITDSFAEISRANIGTVIHFVMQALDLKRTDEINKQLKEMLDKKMLTSEQLEVVDVAAITNFFSTDIGKRLKNSDIVYREYSFCTEISACKLYQNINSEENILVQGTVDCMFVEDDGIVILDYKTGTLNDDYKKQVEIYSMCIEKIFNLPVKSAEIINLL